MYHRFLRTPDDRPGAPRGTRGFTLVELSIVIVIIGVLSAFAVPRYVASIERSKAGEAFNYLASVHSAMERYMARQGTYASDVNDLDIEFAPLEYFTVGSVEVPASLASLEYGWQLALTRAGASSGYGAYTVVFNQDGFDGTESTIPNDINVMQTGS